MIARASDLRVLYAGRAALDGVSVACESGRLVAVVGPNGSGKTTLMRAMLGLIPLDGGSVTIDDRPIDAWSRRALAEQIGALPQSEMPAFSLTVREAMLIGRWSRLGPLAPVGADDESAMAAALAECDMTGFESRRVDTLSGGEWQRVRLARALAGAPSLLFLDEPSAVLDLGHEMQFFELLRRATRNGIGVLAIMHDLNLAARYADQIALLSDGRIVAQGPADVVITPDVVSAVFHWPVTVQRTDDGTPLVVPSAFR